MTLNWENLKVSQGSRRDTGRTISTFSKVGFQVETGLEVGRQPGAGAAHWEAPVVTPVGSD